MGISPGKVRRYAVRIVISGGMREKGQSADRQKADKKKGIEDRCTQTNCIKCGRCISACPLNLMPTELEKAYDRRDKEALMKLKVGLCMNCGSCSYVCPAKRDLAEKNQLAKAFIRT